ncbi:MAG: hypothetical protein AAF802_10845 [Planctomycetota bacterium]
MKRLLAAIAIALSFHCSGQGGVLLQFSADGSTPNLMPVNGVIEVPIFLNQQSTAPTDLNNDGLSAFGFTASVDPNFAEIVSIKVEAPFLEFGRAQSFPTATADFVGVEMGNGVTGSSILLGSIGVRPLVSETFRLDLLDTVALGDDFVTSSGVSLDFDIFSSPSEAPSLLLNSTQIVPEPNSVSFWGVAFITYCVRRRRPNRSVSTAA